MGLYLGHTDLTFGKKGERGYTPVKGVDYNDGLSAYEIAKAQGFKGTEEEFGAELMNAVEAQMLFNRFDSTLTWNDLETIYTLTWTYNGDNYKQVRTELSSVKYRLELFINDVHVGIWTTTIDDANNTRSTVYASM